MIDVNRKPLGVIANQVVAVTASDLASDRIKILRLQVRACA